MVVLSTYHNHHRPLILLSEVGSVVHNMFSSIRYHLSSPCSLLYVGMEKKHRKQDA
jgi:hypothetical protein